MQRNTHEAVMDVCEICGVPIWKNRSITSPPIGFCVLNKNHSGPHSIEKPDEVQFVLDLSEFDNTSGLVREEDC